VTAEGSAQRLDVEVERVTAQRTPIAGAGRVVLSAAALGVAGQLLFFDVGIGLNLPVAVLLLLGAASVLRRPDTRVSLADGWMPAAALALAAFSALRADATLVALDALGALALTGASVASFAGFAVMRLRAVQAAALGARLAGWGAGGATYALTDALGSGGWAGARAGARSAAPVLRGLALAVPLLVVFMALFAAADAVFARAMENALRLDLGSLPGRLLFATVLGWLAGGALAFVAGADRPDPATDSSDADAPRSGIGVIEASIVLASVDFVFAIFVALQAAYLFGGLDTLAASGLTYSEYARRGFFELIAVAVLAGGLLLALETWVRRRPIHYVAAGIVLATLTGVVLVSAAYRLHLYQEAYGWTEPRFYALAVIAWLGLGLVAAMMTIITDRTRRLPHLLTVSGVVMALVVSGVGPVRFVAEQNVARAVDPTLVPPDGETGLDTAYLWSLDDDAVEPLLAALPRLDADTRRAVASFLESRRRVARDPTTARPEWNLARARTAQLLTDAAQRGDLDR
jgi:hypothetical protein